MRLGIKNCLNRLQEYLHSLKPALLSSRSGQLLAVDLMADNRLCNDIHPL